MLYALDGVSPDVDAGAWIAPGCHVIGDIVVLDLASIWLKRKHSLVGSFLTCNVTPMAKNSVAFLKA